MVPIGSTRRLVRLKKSQKGTWAQRDITAFLLMLYRLAQSEMMIDVDPVRSTITLNGFVFIVDVRAL